MYSCCTLCCFSRSSASSQDVSQTVCGHFVFWSGRFWSHINLPGFSAWMFVTWQRILPCSASTPCENTQSLSSRVFSNTCELLHGDRSQTRPAPQESEHLPLWSVCGSSALQAMDWQHCGFTGPGLKLYSLCFNGFPIRVNSRVSMFDQGRGSDLELVLEALCWLPDLWEGVECSFTSLYTVCYVINKILFFFYIYIYSGCSFTPISWRFNWE